MPKLKIPLSGRNFNVFPITCNSVIITQWLLAHAAVSKSVILFQVLVLSRTYLIHTYMYRGVPEIESEEVGRWKALEDVPVVVQERSSEGKAKEGLKIAWRLSSRRRVFDSACT